MADKRSIADIDRDITFLQNSLSRYPRSHPEHINCVCNLAEMRWERYQLSQERQDVDKSILHCTEAIFLPPVFRDGIINSVFHLLFYLAFTLLERSGKFGQPGDLKYSVEYLRYLRGLLIDYESFHPLMSRNLVTQLLIRALGAQIESEAGDWTPNVKEMVVLCIELVTSSTSADFPVAAFDSLNQAVAAEFIRGRPIEPQDGLIECLRGAAKSDPPDLYHTLLALANQLFNRFIKTHSNDDYDEATALYEKILDHNQPGECPDSIRDQASSRITELALYRSTIFENAEYSQVSDVLAGEARDRFKQYSLHENLEEAGFYTSQIVDLSSHESPENSISYPSTLTAYKSAMSLIQKSLSFAPTISIQHTRLVAMGKSCQAIPLDYASYQIGLGQFEGAVETLEQGRGLLWSELRSLRTPMAQLVEEDSPLAKRLAEINQELQALTISITPSGRPEVENNVAQSVVGMDPFGRLVVKQRKLVEERDALISQTQGRPGLEGISSAPSFATLRSAASRGPVITINHSEWRSDILIIPHNYLPYLIPTADDFYASANRLRDELVEARSHGLDSIEYQDVLCSVLKSLYELVGKPVIKGLQALGVPEQSRIWWCPTSVFCSLPLHAVGPIPSRGTSDEQYFSDFYIPSYTPSLSALIESRNGSPQILGKPSLLLVAQPDDYLPGVEGEVKVIRALKGRVAVAELVSSEVTPSSVVNGLRGSHFAHFACRGMLETGKPFDASFKLHGGSRLTLLEMVRSRLPDAEFAFLSCSHAAEITEESIADEALHLTAAMQHCGFRSVVGTMWDMADTDGRDLAKSFYKSLFSGQETSVPYYERSAGALRDATRKLRGKRGITLERWVNFVHYGA